MTKITNHAQRAPSVSTDADLIDLGALLGTLWRGKWLIALISLLAIVLGGIYAFRLATPLYNSTSVVMIETQQQKVLDIESVVGGLSGDTTSLNSEIEVMRSRGLLGKVVDHLDLTNDPEFNSLLRELSFKDKIREAISPRQLSSLPPEEFEQVVRNQTINRLFSRITIRNVPQSLVFQITVQTENAKKSALIADTIADLYILNQLEVKFDATQQATSWLTERVAELQVELEQAEAKVSEFNSGTDLVSIESLQAMERQLKDLRERATNATGTVESNKLRQAALSDSQDSTRQEKADIAEDPQLDRFLNRFNATNEENFAQAFDTRFEQVVARASLEVTRAEQQVQALEASIKRIELQISQQNDDLISLQQLTREAEASRLLYEYFLGRLKETSAQQGIHQADSRILSDAVVVRKPAAPKKGLILILSGFLGLALGCSVVLLMEMRQNTFRTARELENHTGYTVMGQLPLIPAKRRRDALAYLAERPTSAAAEAVRNLRTSVLLSNVDTTPQVIMSTSSVPGEGKTTVSLSMAQNLVGLGKRVLLIEGDIRRRVFNQYLENVNESGLLAVLAGEKTVSEVVVQDERIGADILIGEQTNTNAADVFSSESFAKFISDVRGLYDVIIIDTPPVLVVPDARVIAQSCDAILFTVKWDSTSKPQVEEALRMFESVGQQVTGLVLNQISAQGMKRYGYGGKYGAYAAYGKKYYTN